MEREGTTFGPARVVHANEPPGGGAARSSREMEQAGPVDRSDWAGSSPQPSRSHLLHQVSTGPRRTLSDLLDFSWTGCLVPRWYHQIPSTGVSEVQHYLVSSSGQMSLPATARHRWGTCFPKSAALGSKGSPVTTSRRRPSSTRRGPARASSRAGESAHRLLDAGTKTGARADASRAGPRIAPSPVGSPSSLDPALCTTKLSP